MVDDTRQGDLVVAVLAGLIAAVIAAAGWAAIAFLTGHQYGLVAVAVGIVVGLAVRWGGHGSSLRFGVVGASCALLGVALGNVLALAILVAQDLGVPFVEVVRAMDLEFFQIALTADFGPLDVLFYGIALYEGLRFSMVAVTKAPVSVTHSPAA